jgi:hypothetical protein
MEKEIEKLRRMVQGARSQGYNVPAPDDEDDIHSQLQSPVVNSTYSHTRNPSLMGSEEAVSSLLHLKRGGSYHFPRIVRELEEFKVSEELEDALFKEFFTYYHPFLPFLNNLQPPEHYYQQHPLLYWAIISIACRRYNVVYDAVKGRYNESNYLQPLAGPLHRLLWTTIGEVSQSYHVVKALCLLCTWPIPTTYSTSDPTHILCGVMMKTATGIGLHRPRNIADFSRVAIDINQEGMHDRIKTWAVCNIVAQTIGTGYGQPASSLYDWTLAIRPGESDPSFTLNPELEARLQIERFCDKVSKEMYSNASDPRGVAGDEHRAMLMRVYRRDYGELQSAVLSQKLSPIVNIHLRAAHLHLRLAGFFDASTTPGYLDDLMGLWRATCSFLDHILDGDGDVQEPIDYEFIVKNATNYIQQMLVAAGFALLKLIRSFFVKYIDIERGRGLFHRTITAIRKMSVVNNDLNWRLAELMVQIYNGSRIELTPKSYPPDDASGHENMDDSLQLKVRCRHSMSLVFDLIWHWREEYAAKGRGTLDGKFWRLLFRCCIFCTFLAFSLSLCAKLREICTALKQPTNPDSANESSASSTHLDSTLMPPSHGLPTTLAGLANSNGALTPSAASGLGGAQPSLLGLSNYDSYDVWDPQHWMLDGLLDFNYTSFVPALGEGA